MNITVGDQDIPQSYTTSPDRPFEMVGVRDQYLKLFDKNNERLTDEQVKELAKNPHFTTDNSRINTLSSEANTKRKQEYEQQKFYKMSLQDLTYRVSDSWSDILDDVLYFDTSDGIRGFVQIFLNGDRLIYIGITLFIFTILVLMIRSV